jgi:hypothetical protein
MEYEGWFHGDGDINNIISFLSAHVKDKPGETFRYSSIATFMCSAAVTRLTGQTVSDYLKPRLFEPLGITPYWSVDKKTGANMGGFGLNITLEELAKFGQFILQKGNWEGRQLLPAAWIDEATRKQISNGNMDNDWGMGYGYQFWRCQPEGVFRGDGMYGQNMVICPDDDIVIVMNTNGDHGRSLKMCWELLDDIHTLPADGDGAEELAAHDNLTYLTASPECGPYPELLAEYKIEKSEKMASNLASVVFDFNAGDGIVSFQTDPENKVNRGFFSPRAAFYCAEKQWTKAAAPHPYGNEIMNRITVNGEWKENVLTLTVWYYEMAGRFQFRFTFGPAAEKSGAVNDAFAEMTMEFKGIGSGDKFEEVAKGKRAAL